MVPVLAIIVLQSIQGIKGNSQIRYIVLHWQKQFRLNLYVVSFQQLICRLHFFNLCTMTLLVSSCFLVMLDTSMEDANADNEQDMATSKKERKVCSSLTHYNDYKLCILGTDV